MREDLAGLRRSLAKIEAEWGEASASTLFTLGVPGVDAAIGGGLPRGALHEIFARSMDDSTAASGFGAALARRSGGAGRPIVWVRQDMAAREHGEIDPVGLAEFGIDPDTVILVRSRDALQALRAGYEALRCAALGAVIIEPWGMPAALDLTATQRLSRAAARFSVSAFLVRTHAEPQPSAALSRWGVRARPSRPLLTDAPGLPVFEIDLLRHRAGFPPRRWRVEWDRDQLVFREPALSRAVAAPFADRPLAPAAQTQWRHAG